MTDRLHKSIYGQTLEEMKEDKGAWEYEQEPSGDVISRQALLNLMGEELFNWTDSDRELQAVEDYRNFRNMVEQLPSVKQEPCEDAISRQAVEDALYEYSENNDASYNLIITEYIDTIPSVNLQEKTGHWIDQYNDGNWHCSKCGAIVEKDEQINHNWYFCYHCGAKMVEQEE